MSHRITELSAITLSVLVSAAGLTACGGPLDEPLDSTVDNTEEAIRGGRTWRPEGWTLVRGGRRSHCAATLLRNDWAVTARDCLQTSQLENRRTVRLDMNGRIHSSRQVVVHPAYNVALVQVSTPFTIAGSVTGYERPIRRTNMRRGNVVTCVGAGGTLPVRLRQAFGRVSAAGPDHFAVERQFGQPLLDRDQGGACHEASTRHRGSRMLALAGVITTCHGRRRSADCDIVGAGSIRGWLIESMNRNRYGAAVAHGDFDGDGRIDLAIGHPGDGEVHVELESAPYPGFEDQLVPAYRPWQTQQTLTRFDGQIIDRCAPETCGPFIDRSRFGATLVAYDVNDDHYDDLLVGAPGGSRGAVYLYLGSATGLVRHVLPGRTAATPWIRAPRLGGEFGASLAVGDFHALVPYRDLDDEDERHGVEIAVGEPGKNTVHIYELDDADPVPSPWTRLTQNVGRYARFGHALAAGEYTDTWPPTLPGGLAVSAPGEDTVYTYTSGASGMHARRTISSATAAVYSGNNSRLSASARALVRSDLSSNALDGASAYGNQLLGWSLASGDMNDDRIDELAVGAPNQMRIVQRRRPRERCDGARNSYGYCIGRTTLLPGAYAFRRTGVVFVARATSRSSGGSSSGSSRRAVPVGRSSGNGNSSGPNVQGQVSRMSAFDSGLDIYWQPAGRSFDEHGDFFGARVELADFDDDGDAELAASAPGEVWSRGAEAGAVYLYDVDGNDFLLGQSGIGSNETGDWFGSSLAGVDFNGDGRADFVIGALGEAVGPSPASGAVFTFFSDSFALPNSVTTSFVSLTP